MKTLPLAKPQARSATQRGFSMIEVLVSLLVLSIGLLGLAMLQVQGLKFNSDAYVRTQATILAYDLMDRMRANNKAAEAGSYTVAIPTAAVTGCCTSGADRAKQDLYEWYGTLTTTLPGASATISGASSTTIIIRWMERDLPITQSWNISL
jgi:type IV pilus assembly protein PilV